jgi:hypothetical protein
LPTPPANPEIATPTTKESLMKMTLKTAKPRNPYVAASLRRSAGSHRPSTAAVRQQARQGLRREITGLHERHRHTP